MLKPKSFSLVEGDQTIEAYSLATAVGFGGTLELGSMQQSTLALRILQSLSNFAIPLEVLWQ